MPPMISWSPEHALADESRPILKDRQGRVIENLRLSVTDRCNFRCVYCMPPDGLDWVPKENVLTFEEFTRLVQVAVGLGLRRFRLTGGEPLVRTHLDRLVAMILAVPGVEDLSLTTNGVLLAAQAQKLAAAGLRRVNVSLDSLLKETFERMARRDALDAVMEGLRAAAEHFPGPVKVNAVVLRGLNDGEVVEFARLARRANYEMRFIEFMPLDADRIWSMERLVSGEEIRSTIHAAFPLVPDPTQDPRAPSRDWVFADGSPGKVGFINSVTEPFCDTCNRIRVTAEGKLRTCLFSVRETNLREMLRGGAPDSAIAEAIRAAVWDKEPGHKINQPGFVHASRSMSQIGG